MAAEIFSTVERRRRWPGEEKVRIMGEALADGASVAAVADRNGVCRSQLYTWLRLAREGKLPGISLNAVKPTRFVPVAIEAAADAPTSSPRVSVVPAGAPPAVAPGSSLPSPSPTVRGRRPAMIEIVLSNGRIMKVDETIDPDAPARLIAVLDDSARLRQDDSARSARDGGRSC
jgi:transposase